MIINYNSDKPIFLQIAEGIEDAILSGAFAEGQQIPSITEFSVNYKINPATALKGISMLVDSGIIYKQRGVGMFVSEGALELLRKKRKDGFFDNYIAGLVAEARRLEIPKDEVKEMVERGFEQ